MNAKLVQLLHYSPFGAVSATTSPLFCGVEGGQGPQKTWALCSETFVICQVEATLLSNSRANPEQNLGSDAGGQPERQSAARQSQLSKSSSTAVAPGRVVTGPSRLSQSAPLEGTLQRFLLGRRLGGAARVKLLLDTHMALEPGGACPPSAGCASSCEIEATNCGCLR